MKTSLLHFPILLANDLAVALSDFSMQSLGTWSQNYKIRQATDQAGHLDPQWSRYLQMQTSRWAWCLQTLSVELGGDANITVGNTLVLKKDSTSLTYILDDGTKFEGVLTPIEATAWRCSWSNACSYTQASSVASVIAWECDLHALPFEKHSALCPLSKQ